MKMKHYMSILATAACVISCNGGGGGGGGGGTPDITGDTIYVAGESSPVFSTISCLSAVVNTRGQITLTSACPQPVVVSNISLVFKSQDVTDRNPVLFESSVVSTDGNYGLTFEQLSANKVGALLSIVATPESSSTITPYYLNSESSIVFAAPIITSNKDEFDAELATASMEIIKPTNNLELLDQDTSSSLFSNVKLNSLYSLQAIGDTGTLAVGIDTRYAGCGKYTNCHGLTANVLDSDGDVVATVRVPDSQIGTAYIGHVNNLVPGVYSINAPLLPNAQGTFDNGVYSQVVNAREVKTALQLRYQSTLGKLNLVIHTNQAKCSKNDCSTITIGVSNVAGKLVSTFSIPTSANGGTFTQVLDGLPQGLYNFNGYSSNGFAVDLQPKSGAVQVYAQREVTVDMNFRPPTTTGSVTIKLGKPEKWSSDSVIPLNFQIYNTVTGALVLTMPITPGSQKVVSLPITDTTHKYQAFLTQGFASPESNLFYMQTAPVKFDVKSGGTNIVTLGPIANASEQRLTSEKVAFNVSGLTSGDKVQITSEDSFKKFAYGLPSRYTDAQANNLQLWYPKGALIAARANADGNYQTNPKYVSFVALNKSVANVQFSESNVAAVFDYVPTYSYAYDSLIYIPVNPVGGAIKYYGLNSYVVTNVTSGKLSNISYESANFPSGISVDDTRTTCNRLGAAGLKANQTCVMVFKYAPTTANVWSSFSFVMKFTNESNNQVFSSVINVPYSSRAR